MIRSVDLSFWCVICWRRCSPSQGCCDDVDRAVCAARVHVDPEPGLCDDCWYGLGGADLVARAL